MAFRGDRSAVMAEEANVREYELSVVYVRFAEPLDGVVQKDINSSLLVERMER